MKKQLSILLVMVVALIGLSACQKSTKSQLVGTWKYSEVEVDDDTQTTVNGTLTMDEKGTFTESANVTCVAEGEVNDVDVQVKVGGSAIVSGDWTVNDDEKNIVFSGTSAKFNLQYIRYYDTSDNSLIAELTGEDLREASASYVQTIEASLKKAGSEHIIMLQENKYVTESTDNDGKTSTTTFTK